jgi:DNA-directed RNA polymerase specialized sigma24 family protein
MVDFRMDPRLRGRLDAADVVQEAFVEASEHRGDYFRAQYASLQFRI